MYKFICRLVRGGVYCAECGWEKRKNKVLDIDSRYFSGYNFFSFKCPAKEKTMKKREESIDLIDINARVAIAVSLTIIAFVLVYLVFLR